MSISLEEPETKQEKDNPKAKKRKTDDSKEVVTSNRSTTETEETEEARIQRKRDQRAAKRDLKRQRKALAKEQKDRQKAKKRAEKTQQEPKQSKRESRKPKEEQNPASVTDHVSEKDDEEDDDGIPAEAIEIDDSNALALATSAGDDALSDDSGVLSRTEENEVFSPFHESGISSTSSIQPPGTEDLTDPPNDGKKPVASVPDDVPEADAKVRLQAKIASLRAERNADFKPKSRGELLAHRRKLEDKRRADKKEQRRLEKEDEARKQDEEIARRFSPGGSGSLLGSPRSPLPDGDTNNFSFGRIAFGDGADFDPDNATQGPKKKGPQDPATALKAALSKEQRISGLDSSKQANISDKDMWLNARKRAAGEKVKDDASLLKKALKRHEGQKKKSEKEWTERKEGIQKGIEMKQKKRTDNLAKRREEKGTKHSKGKTNKVKRPGFEGSFKGRTSGGKKKS